MITVAPQRRSPRLASEQRVLLARLDEAPVSVVLPNPATGRPMTASIDRAAFVSRVHLLLFSSPLAARLPLLVHEAYEGRWTLFAALAAAFGKAIADRIDFGQQLSVLCAEKKERIQDFKAGFLPMLVWVGLITVLVLLHHLMITYAGSGSWYYLEPPQDFAAIAVGVGIYAGMGALHKGYRGGDSLFAPLWRGWRSGKFDPSSACQNSGRSLCWKR